VLHQQLLLLLWEQCNIYSSSYSYSNNTQTVVSPQSVYLFSELPPPIEVVASWSMLPSEQDYPRSKGCSFPSFTNYMANFSRFFDAFISLSWIAPQFGHSHSLNAKFFTSTFLYPHLLHI